ncbi:hypothetical protein [Flexithrix dorotheae]|uniref:hypothetical protein n=1 Tax=Flexithrix dorotheae TaxID=70993 RepID=UPI00037CD06D|nr:hypothetical protein [Flexithrix dorotheae]
MKSLKITLAVIAFCMMAGHLQAFTKINKNSWKAGWIILQTGEKKLGEIKFNYKLELIQYKTTEGKIKVYTPEQIKKFRFFDETFQIDRVFISINSKKSYYTKSSFYEVLAWGDLPILGKLKFEDFSEIEASKAAEGNYQPKFVGYDYFILIGEDLVEIADFRKNILPQLNKEDERLLAFWEKGKSDPNPTFYLLQYITYYNSLQPGDIFRFEDRVN